MANLKRILQMLLLQMYAVCRELFYHYFIMFFNLPASFRYYFQTWLTIHRPTAAALTQGTTEFATRRARIWTVKFYFLAMMARSFLNLALMYPHLSDFWRTILWDQFYLQGGDPAWNWLYFIVGPFPAFNYYRMYFYRAKASQAKRETVALVGCFLGEGDPRFTDRIDSKYMHVDPKKIRHLEQRLLYFVMVGNKYLGMFLDL